MIITIANELGVSLNYLLTGELDEQLPQQEHQRVVIAAAQDKEVNRQNDDMAFISKKRLITAIETLEEILEIRQRVMTSENKAQMVWIIYGLLSEDETDDKENNNTFIVQLAEKLVA
ncbi:hypothetical protein [Muribacter muris]|nr:hypothetical protein [Muribacter muris]